ncbi:hypothetical protein BU16DRAFT_567819 [Lophium mytilinum]|uniref:Arb2 domain-containing protein n=1 Tax=Lophium mytilinum TaxID=390894 RepID=A0A6A6Q9A9_9PEZI|nr:hypothetical protein BU16DRAFT_567819 [Lophium mytilinum]
MFHLQHGGAGADPVYPENLEALGYFVTEDGFIKSIKDPNLNFNFHLTNDARHNEVHREAMHQCTRAEVYFRLEALGIMRFYLPTFSEVPPDRTESIPHLAILATRFDILKTRKRVIVVVNDSKQDLGILAYRLLHRSAGIDGGSVANFVKEMRHRSFGDTYQDHSADDIDSRPGLGADIPVLDKLKVALTKASHEVDVLKKRPATSSQPSADVLSQATYKAAELSQQLADMYGGGPPGVIVLNTGQLYFSYERNEAMTMTSWEALPRKSRISGSRSIADANRVGGNETPKAHIEWVFKHIINSGEYVHPKAEVYVVGIESGAKDLLMLMNRKEDVGDTLFPFSSPEKGAFSRPLFPSQIKAMAFIQPGTTADEIEHAPLANFLRHRTRAWVKPENDEPANIPVSKPTKFDGAWAQTEEGEPIDTAKPESKPRKDSGPIKALVSKFTGGPDPHAVNTQAKRKINWLEVMVEPEEKEPGKLRKALSSMHIKAEHTKDVVVGALSLKKRTESSDDVKDQPTATKPPTSLASHSTAIDPHTLGVLDSPSPSPSSTKTVKPTFKSLGESTSSSITTEGLPAGDENVKPASDTKPTLPSDESKEKLVERPKAFTSSSSKGKEPATTSTASTEASQAASIENPASDSPPTISSGEHREELVERPKAPTSSSSKGKEPATASPKGNPATSNEELAHVESTEGGAAATTDKDVLHLPASEGDPTPTNDPNDASSSYSNPICLTFSGGPGVDDTPADHPECIFPRMFKSVLDFFEEVARDPENYRNPDYEIVKVAPRAEDSGRGTAYTQEQLNEMAEQELGGAPGSVGGAAPSGSALVGGASTTAWQTKVKGPTTEVAGQQISEQALKDAGLDVL